MEKLRAPNVRLIYVLVNREHVVFTRIHSVNTEATPIVSSCHSIEIVALAVACIRKTNDTNVGGRLVLIFERDALDGCAVGTDNDFQRVTCPADSETRVRNVPATQSYGFQEVVWRAFGATIRRR